VSDLLILAATELETRALARRLELVAEHGAGFPRYAGAGMRLAPLGVGASRLAERLPRLLEGLRAPLVISAGVCGALDPSLRHGDLVLPGAVLRPGGSRLAVDPAAHARALARVERAAAGSLVTVAAVAATAEAKVALREQTGAVAVDMESAAIALGAGQAGCPALVVRAVSDVADESLPAELLLVAGADGRLSLGAAAGLLASPRALARAVSLGRATSRALGTVARALAALAA
jgi:adenosylhomocysteine nucleosidase